MASVANYLLREKRRGRVLDPVGNFHIANGAMVRQLNFLGNASVQGSRESGTVMVNYHYEVEQIATRVSAYALRRDMAAAAPVEQLLLRPA
ncbi:hypothetical protein STCU_10200 [Strigomonas culicis]|uniref:Malonyl-CoA decarboxylase C-terminal domain-containing protein n=1 Tax=Strigomonas culicis TaxID=28005 RepID=S9TNX3_9TRYP|nr:hypothetical protein STCU_10200 [Strigomonas culicis]|eukprot:EPY18083.1 hypothetical protein STCU_10200 [Strigomonas culicis]